ncbi:MAG: hypothetical protein WBW75_05840, partial [Mycobacterium sp.]
MSDNPTTGPTSPDAPETLQSRNAIDHPTNQLPPAPYPGESRAESGAEAPTRAFAGFRTEQRRPAADARA